MKIISLFVILLGTAFSQEKGRDGKLGKGPRGPQGGKNHGEQFFKHYDADQDGKVIREEFDAGRRVKDLAPEVRDRLFKRLDKDNDGVILKKDVKQSSEEKGPPRHHMRRILDKVDLNKDGEITLEEFSKNPRLVKMNEKRRQKLFESIDRNNDGVISAKDRPDPRPEGGRDPIKSFDLNKDGTLSLAEFRNLPHHIGVAEEELSHRFDELDSNHDGQLSKDELKKGHSKLKPRR